MSNNIKWNWKDSQKVGMSDVATGLNLGEDFRYTICPPKVRHFTTKLDLTYRRRCNAQWERMRELRDRGAVWDRIANGYVWDRDKEQFVVLDTPYEIADHYGNIRLLDKETGKKKNLYEGY
jgi:hypothetical protein